MNDLIFGAGYEDAELMIIGDYVRKADSTAHQALSGYYKNKLAEYLKIANFSVDQTYRTCIIKRYVQGLGVDTFAADKKLLEFHFDTAEGSLSEYIGYLIDEINTVKPSVIICMGEYALRTLTGKDGVGKWRGSVLSFAPDILAQLTYPLASNTKIVVSYHPSVTHIQEELQYIIRKDFTKAVDLLNNPNRMIDYHEIYIARSSIDFLRFIEQYPVSKFKEMTFDIETHLGFITCAGFSFDGFRGLTFPCYGQKDYDIVDRARMMYLMSQLLEERDLINQNIGYDKRVSNRFGWRMRKIVWDTMLAAHTIACEFPKRLDFLTSIHTDMSFYKDEGREFDPKRDSYDRLYEYNCKDAITTFQIYKKQIVDLEELEMLDFFRDFVMRLFDMYYDIDSVGLKQDQNKKRELLGKYEGLYHLKEMELKAIVEVNGYGDINIASSSQVGQFMDAANFPVLRHRVANGHMVVNTDVDSLKKMKITDPAEWRRGKIPYEQGLRFINLVLLTRRIAKIIEYINVGVHPYGRIHTSSKIAGTTSGRTSGGQCSDQIWLWGWEKKKYGLKQKNLGQSFQTVTKHGFIIDDEEEVDIEDGTIGKDIREMYIPDDGFVIVEGDGSQAEARVCDVLGEDYEGLEEYKKFDKHCKVASMIYSKMPYKGRTYTYEEIFQLAKREHNDDGIYMRNIGKHSKHAKNNGLEPPQFARLYIPVANYREALGQARQILGAIDKAYPNIEQVFHKQVEQHLRDARCLISPLIYGLPCGRKRFFFKKIDKHYLNVAYSHLPQSTISDHTKAAGLRIRERMDKSKAYLVAENHDSLTALVHYTYLRTYCKIFKEEYERPIDFRGCSLSRDFQLIIPCEFAISRRNWGAMHEPKRINWSK